MAVVVTRLKTSMTKISTWISKRIKRFKCQHDYTKIHEACGDKVLIIDYRSLWQCNICDKHRKSWRIDELV